MAESAGYWLFKAEPDVYGIGHLAQEPQQTGRWDGIRNYQARNFLRDRIRKDDQLFLYHSQTRQPGIAGIARVVKAAYADPLQFDPQSSCFDPKSDPANPRWVAVDIQLQHRFENLLTLSWLKQQEALEGMVLLRQPRLSIQPVSPAEWQFILQAAAS